MVPSVITDDPEGRGNIPKPFCSCSDDSKWNGTSCIKFTNQSLCEESGGKWNLSNCICPIDETVVGWYKFKEGSGCVRVLPSDILLKDANNQSQKNSVKIIVITLLSILFIFIGITLSVKRRKL